MLHFLFKSVYKHKLYPFVALFHRKEKNLDKIIKPVNSVPQNIQEFDNIQSELRETYIHKNSRYGNSFDISVGKYGPISALTRISDKFLRLENLVLNQELQSDTDEALEDTLLDMANYCIMFVSYLRRNQSKEEESC